MLEHRPIIGDWMGSLYTAGGDRREWVLSLSRDGSYRRSTAKSPNGPTLESGTFTYNEESETIDLVPTAEPDKRTTWWVLDVTKCEWANTLLVLRECVLGSRILPILLYRVHNKPFDS